MSFKVTKSPTFTHDVKVMTPVDGGHREETLKATFNLLDVDAVGAFDLATRAGTTNFLKAVVAKLDGLTGDDDKPLPSSDELRDHLLQKNHVRLALAQHYFDAVGKDPKAGN